MYTLGKIVGTIIGSVLGLSVSYLLAQFVFGGIEALQLPKWQAAGLAVVGIIAMIAFMCALGSALSAWFKSQDADDDDEPVPAANTSPVPAGPEKGGPS